jgi:AcrR family transcriptional regulator
MAGRTSATSGTEVAAPRRAPSRPGGRSTRVRSGVLAAVLQELTEVGYDSLTVEAVAARSGVHRATIYRRWRDVGGLLADALRASREEVWVPPDTGSLAGDLVALNREIHAAFTERPSISAALVAASFRSAEAAEALREFWADRYARCEPVIVRAVTRAEIPSGPDARRILIAATAPLFHNLVLLGGPLSADAADQYARDAAAAASADIYRAEER